jgi:hypothetical protein
LYYVIYVLGSDSAKKYCPTHIFPFLEKCLTNVVKTPCLTNVGKRPDNFEFSEKCFRSHNGRGKILKDMKAQANGIICSGMTDKYL